jgi:integrase
MSGKLIVGDLTLNDWKAVMRYRKLTEKKAQPKIDKSRYPVNRYEKDNDFLHLYVNDVRVLTPYEYKRLKDAIPKERYKTVFDILMITGMRYVELARLYNCKQWYNEKRNLIHLPEEAQQKHKRTQQERTIHPLPSMFNYLLRDLWNGAKLPAQTTFNKDLQRWAKLAGINPYGISVKTSRKTIESWCVAAGILESTVCLRQGHDSLTSMKHYQGLAFSDDELRDIKKILTEWSILR